MKYKLKDRTFIEGLTLYVRCNRTQFQEVCELFKEGFKFKFDRAFKMVFKSILISL